MVAGGHYRTGQGMVEMLSVEPVAASKLRAADAHAAGFPTLAAFLADVPAGEGRLYLLRFRRLDTPDPRSVLAADADLDDAARAALDARLARLDKASPHGPWTATTLGLVRDHPGVRAPDLAASVGRDTLPFKIDVRKLKALGLTESLLVGYRLSPRGRAYLEAG
ncbi:hypothetical protein Afe04nite_36960 [Asanoa ferruginea]|nr:hypothetical protein Afe04nite_36960 [Asanoa ferruginea]